MTEGNVILLKDTDIDLAYADLRKSDMVATDKVGNGYLEFNTLTGTLKKTVPLFKTLNTLALKTDNNLNTFLMKDTATFLGSIDTNQDWNTLPTTSGWYQVNNFAMGKNAPVGATTYGFLLHLVGNSADTQTQIYFPRVDPANSASIPRVRSTWSNPVKWSAWSLLTQGYTKEEIDSKDKVVTDIANDHIGNRNNPHGVNAEQVGTYNKATIDTKDNRLQTNLTNHINNKSNPHEVTASQVGAMASGTAYTKAEVDSKIKALNDTKEAKIKHWVQNGADGINGWYGSIQYERWGHVCTVIFNLQGGKMGTFLQIVNMPDWALPSSATNKDPWCVVQSSSTSGKDVGTVYVSRGGKGLFTNNVSNNGNILGTVTYLTD